MFCPSRKIGEFTRTKTNNDVVIDRYDIMMMRSRKNRTTPPSASALREERLELGQTTDTGVSGLVNHMPRQLGTYIGKAQIDCLQSVSLQSIVTRG